MRSSAISGRPGPIRVRDAGFFRYEHLGSGSIVVSIARRSRPRVRRLLLVASSWSRAVGPWPVGRHRIGHVRIFWGRVRIPVIDVKSAGIAARHPIVLEGRRNVVKVWGSRRRSWIFGKMKLPATKQHKAAGHRVRHHFGKIDAFRRRDFHGSIVHPIGAAPNDQHPGDARRNWRNPAHGGAVFEGIKSEASKEVLGYGGSQAHHRVIYVILPPGLSLRNIDHSVGEDLA